MPTPLRIPTTHARMGNPPYVPTDDARHVVTVMRANGNSIETIARALRVSGKTITRHFKAELEHGFDDVRARIEAAMVKAALAGSVAAQCRWLAKHCTDWRFSMTPDALPPDPTMTTADAGSVHFYLPPNGRDQPDPDDEAPTLDGEAEAA